jgi:heterogeneous nuclear ribonucleoprotein F/H
MALAYQLSGMAISRGPPPRGPPPSGVGMGGVLLPPVVPHGGGYGAPGGGSEGLSSQIAAAGIDSDSKTVKIRGLPFRATALDIFNFFEGFSIAAETLQLGVDALGRPSGEAWLTFASAEEALRAVRERNRHYLGSRYLELSLT